MIDYIFTLRIAAPLMNTPVFLVCYTTWLESYYGGITSSIPTVCKMFEGCKLDNNTANCAEECFHGNYDTLVPFGFQES